MGGFPLFIILRVYLSIEHQGPNIKGDCPYTALHVLASIVTSEVVVHFVLNTLNCQVGDQSSGQ